MKDKKKENLIAINEWCKEMAQDEIIYVDADASCFYNKKYEAVLGFNTKQWWVYDNETDVYIDPPNEVLEDIKKFSSDINEQEKYFNNILATEPEWLKDEDYYYDDIE